MSGRCVGNGNADDGDCTAHKYPSEMYSGVSVGHSEAKADVSICKRERLQKGKMT